MRRPNDANPHVSNIPWGASLRLIAPLAALKLIVLLSVHWTGVLMPPLIGEENYQIQFHWPPDAPITAATAYSTWDAAHYLNISENGYALPNERCFYPLWPAIIHVTSHSLSIDPLLASLIAANFISLAALILLHRLAALRTDLATADVTLLLALVFPSAFVLCLPYSESLFLLLAVGLFLAMQTERPVWIWIAGALLPLSRAVGIVCLCPIIVDQLLKRRPLRALLLATGPLAGLAAYFVIFKVMTGSATSGLDTAIHATDANTSLLLQPIHFLQLFFRPGLELHGIHNSLIDRTVFLIFLASLWPMARRNLVDAAFAIPAGIIPAMTLSMMSFTRFALVLFPMFLLGAHYLSAPKRRWWLWVVCALSLSIYMMLFFRHVHFDWAG